MPILPEIEKRFGEAIGVRGVAPCVFPAALQPAAAVEKQNAKRQQPLDQIRVKHRGDGWRKKILAENALAACRELALRRRVSHQRIEYHRAHTSSGNAADRKNVIGKTGIDILDRAEHGCRPISCANSATFGCDDKEWMHRSPAVFHRDLRVPIEYRMAQRTAR